MKIVNGAVMHMLFATPMPAVPSWLWWLLGQYALCLLMPTFFPGTLETLEYMVTVQMIGVNIFAISIIGAFVARMLFVLAKDADGREQLKNQYLLGAGIDEVANSVLPDIFVFQRNGEAVEAFQKRAEAARYASSKSYWAVIMPYRSPFAVVYMGAGAEGNIINRADLEWEREQPAEARICAAGYDFTGETEERYHIYARRFAEGWAKWAPAGKAMYFRNNNGDAVSVVLNNIREI